MDCPDYEQLAAHLNEPEVQAHIAACGACRGRSNALARADAAAASLVRQPQPATAAAAALRAVMSVANAVGGPPIMTLDDVAAFLRLEPQQFGQIAEELPAFELAGQVRVRRDRLMQWIEQREREYTRAVVQSRTARLLREAFLKAVA